MPQAHAHKDRMCTDWQTWDCLLEIRAQEAVDRCDGKITALPGQAALIKTIDLNVCNAIPLLKQTVDGWWSEVTTTGVQNPPLFTSDNLKSFATTYDCNAETTAYAWVQACSNTESPANNRSGYAENRHNFPNLVLNNTVVATRSCHRWWRQIESFSVPQGTNIFQTNEGISNFAQMAWDTHEKIGCAIKKCPDFILSVCHYGPGAGQPGNQIYKMGPTCRRCPAGTTGGERRWMRIRRKTDNIVCVFTGRTDNEKIEEQAVVAVLAEDQVVVVVQDEEQAAALALAVEQAVALVLAVEQAAALVLAVEQAAALVLAVEQAAALVLAAEQAAALASVEEQALVVVQVEEQVVVLASASLTPSLVVSSPEVVQFDVPA
ncbi:SCP-like protein [Necator americanus]|uniref:SCP-like protein n=1 Tax=Necator americanus TaxID=51031 RepID=W2T579_NECAM|nr:SCP-like protein [Necator americanus]ETN77068.1 SCP-like protein [Necator americanus]